MTRPVCRWCGARGVKGMPCTGGNGCSTCCVRPCRHTAHLTSMYRHGPGPNGDLQRALEDEGFEVGLDVAWRAHVWPDGWWVTETSPVAPMLDFDTLTIYGKGVDGLAYPLETVTVTGDVL